MHRTRKLSSVAIAAVMLGSVFALPSAAHAAVPGLDRESNSVSGTADFQSVTATCDVGKVLVGAGYQVNGATGEVIVDDFVPTIGPTGSVWVGAYEADPDYAPNWTLTAWAICANPVPGLVRVSETSPASEFDKSVSVSCPAGTVPISTGYQLNGALGEVAVNLLRATATGGQVTAYAEDDVDSDWSVTVFLICANPLPGMLHVSATDPVGGSPDFESVPGGCPAGRVLLGMGFLVSGASGEVVVDDFNPSGGPATAPTSLTVGAYEADPNYVPNWSLTSYGTCATA
jgi:hypothetical protein